MTSIVPVHQIVPSHPDQIALRPETRERIGQIFEDNTPANTKRAYQADIRYFWAWAELTFGASEAYPVSVGLVIEFITDQVKGMKPEVEAEMIRRKTKAITGPENIRTLSRRIGTLSIVHKFLRVENPCKDEAVIMLMIKARKNPPALKKKKAIPLDILFPLLSTCRTDIPENLVDIRDAALLYFAFSSGGRRASEVAMAAYENLVLETYIINGVEQEGFIYFLGKTKTTSADRPHPVPIKGLAFTALQLWLRVSGIRNGRIFRSIKKGGKIMGESISSKSINRIVKKRCRLIGLPPDDFGAHSLRSGFMTEAARQNKNLPDVMKLSTHRSVDVAMGYYEAQDTLKNPAGNLVG